MENLIDDILNSTDIDSAIRVYRRIKRLQMKDNPQVKLYNPLWSGEDTDVVDLDKIEFLKGNPFLYDPLNSPYIVSSIEDYRIKYKKNYQAFGHLIRNATYSRYRRRRIAKKAFLLWEKDVKKTQEKKIIEGDECH